VPSIQPEQDGDSNRPRKKYVDRQKALKQLEELRPGRLALSIFNLDRQSHPPIPGLATQFQADLKEPLFRVLKESFASENYQGIDLYLYTRGGDTNAVWPVVNLLREFDKDFEVLVPFRCHSSGTLVALGAKQVVMGKLAELSPIDPTCGNRFNPIDSADPNKPLGISVEDVRSYRDFVLEQLSLSEAASKEKPENWRAHVVPLIEKLTDQVHPLALGNVHRVVHLIEQLAGRLLDFHSREGENPDEIVQNLTTGFFSHTHMLDRHEAKTILGDRVVFADDKLDGVMDEVLGCYKQSFRIWETFFWVEQLGDSLAETLNLVGGVVESRHWSYLNRTTIRMTQASQVPQGVNIQVPPGQPMPLIPGLPRARQSEVVSQGWARNARPTGVTV